MSRVIIVMAALLAAGTSAAEELNAEAAQQFVAGRLFTFRCFEGTRGIGRIRPRIGPPIRPVGAGVVSSEDGR
jgi:hypothetical protein